MCERTVNGPHNTHNSCGIHFPLQFQIQSIFNLPQILIIQNALCNNPIPLPRTRPALHYSPLLTCRKSSFFPYFSTLVITITLAPLYSSPRFFPHGHEQYRRKMGATCCRSRLSLALTCHVVSAIGFAISSDSGIAITHGSQRYHHPPRLSREMSDSGI
jgi:hypothetical protein